VHSPVGVSGAALGWATVVNSIPLHMTDQVHLHSFITSLVTMLTCNQHIEHYNKKNQDREASATGAAVTEQSNTRTCRQLGDGQLVSPNDRCVSAGAMLICQALCIIAADSHGAADHWKVVQAVEPSCPLNFVSGAATQILGHHTGFFVSCLSVSGQPVSSH
jgi:hypothetical protein